MTVKKRIYIAYTGGQIAMKPSKDGFIPAIGYLSQTIAKSASVINLWGG